jgi:hypothetical protein
MKTGDSGVGHPMSVPATNKRRSRGHWSVCCSGLASYQARQNSCDRNVTIARHKSIEMLRVYCRDAELFGNAATGLL